MTMTTAQADMAIRDRQGRLIALVEVKAGPHITPEAAAQVRDYVLDQARSVPYFLLVSADRVFLWSQTKDGVAAAQELSCPMDAIIARYWPSRKSGRRVSSDQLQFITRLWLMDLTRAFPDELAEEASQCLAESGLVEAMHEGTVLAEAT